MRIVPARDKDILKINTYKRDIGGVTITSLSLLKLAKHNADKFTLMPPQLIMLTLQADVVKYILKQCYDASVGKPRDLCND